MSEVCEVPRCFSGDVMHYYRSGTGGSSWLCASPIGASPVQARDHVYCADHAIELLGCAIGHRRRAWAMPLRWEGDDA